MRRELKCSVNPKHKRFYVTITCSAVVSADFAKETHKSDQDILRLNNFEIGGNERFRYLCYACGAKVTIGHC